MPIVNYIKEHETFIEYAIEERLSSAEREVWTTLFYIMKSKARGANWPDGFIKVPNERLLSLVPFGFDAMARARNKLMERGLISYIKGARNSEVPMYQMHYLTVPEAEAPQIDDLPEDHFPQVPAAFPERSDNYPDSQGLPEDSPADEHMGCRGDDPENGPEKVPENPDKPADIYSKLNVIVNSNVKPTYKYDEEEERGRAHATSSGYSVIQKAEVLGNSLSARGFQEVLVDRVAKDIRCYFGYRGTPAECRRIAAMAEEYHLDADLVDESIRIAAENHVRSLYAYLFSVYKEWGAHDVRTLNEYAKFRLTKDKLMDRLKRHKRERRKS